MSLQIDLDDWQKDVLATKGNKVICSGRQVGKSTIISIEVGEYALSNPNKSIMIIAKVERQALLLFEKVLSYIHDRNKKMIGTKKDKPTKHELKLKNGTIIRCLPVGESGYGIRGHTIDRLYADEAAFIPDEVWAAVTPMLVTTGGDIILLSTPYGRQGYFYRCYNDKKFTKFHINSEEVAKKRKPEQSKRMLEFLEDEKRRMTTMQYAQEFLGEFVDELAQLFSDDLIKKIMTLRRKSAGSFSPNRDYFLGVDVAGMGGDESTFEILQKVNNNYLRQVENMTQTKTLTTMTTRQIINLDNKYNFKKIFVDDGGLGFGVFSELLENEQTRRKTIPINNAQKSMDKDRDGKKKKLLKEDLYNNLLGLMERGEIELLDDPEIFQSLKSVQYSYEDGKFRIFGNYTHIAEGLIRAAWCIKEKSLKLWIDYI